MRASTVTQLRDLVGVYETEVFECNNPKSIILGVHGNGVRRWDGEKFYYQLADYFKDSIVLLVDQNQQEGDGCKLNSLDIMVERNQKALEVIHTQYPSLGIWVIGHSMGCGVSALMNLTNVTGVVFVAPVVGEQYAKYLHRYGKDIVNGMIVTTSDGLYKNISKEFMESVRTIYWQEQYSKMLETYSNVFVFEAGSDEIIDEERFELRDMQFAKYSIIEGAKHNFKEKYAQELFTKIDELFA